MTANDGETVREVCAEMRECKAESYASGGCNDCRGFDCRDVRTFADRILAAYERDMAAKDAEIARLKAALKPVMEVDVPSVVRLPSIGEPKFIRDLNYAQNAVREAQRIMKEGETK